jgi:competence protein ComEA
LERVKPWVRVDGTPPAGPPPAGVTTSKKVDAVREPIDVNRAGVEDLTKLPGVGPKLAQRIIDERAKKPFLAVDDLRRVSGIGPKTIEKLRPFVTVIPVQ